MPGTTDTATVEDVTSPQRESRLDSALAGAAVFLGAGLLFAVQPIAAKRLLPWFGGAASVWTACMLFFQCALLLGYLYAHLLAGRAGKRVAAIHLGLLGASLVLLPAIPDASWKPRGDEEPALMILGALAASIGLPYTLLAATSPLTQWLHARRGGGAPYRLFALSNLASLMALLSYPVIVEPFLELRTQAWVWSAMYGAYVAVMGTLLWRSGATGESAASALTEPVTAAPSWAARISWIALSACASALFLSVTNHVCQNIAPIPFFWVLPLAIYLLTFILCFDSDRWYQRKLFLPLQAIAIGVLAYPIWRPSLDVSFWLLAATAGALFCLCMYCHGELAARRPAPAHLTQFYLLVSAGGAIGGFCVSVLAPLLLSGYFEFTLSIAACAGMMLILEYRKNWIGDVVFTALAVGALSLTIFQMRTYATDVRVIMRNFYGGLRVLDSDAGTPQARRVLAHGLVNHGVQPLAAEKRREPTAYYTRNSGAYAAIKAFQDRGARIGVIGLGAGVLATYGRDGDYYRFYEINPQVIEVARRDFTYLKDSAAKVDVALGDGRLSLEREPEQKFNVLVVDAFSGDSIPVHMLTREAVALYFERLLPQGILALHISNVSLDLEPVVEELAKSGGYSVRLYPMQADDRITQNPAQWALLTRGNWPASLNSREYRALNTRPGIKAWTDSYSNLFQILK
jgi:hypothetical protein